MENPPAPPGRLILHLGFHKTGTSYLQQQAWGNWPGIDYVGRPNPKGFQSSEIAALRSKAPIVMVSNESAGGSLKDSYLQNGNWAVIQERKLAFTKAFFAPFGDVRIIVSLRRSEQWVVSVYKHYLKFGGVESLGNFLGLGGGVPATFSGEDLLFIPKIDAIRRIFGTEPFCFFIEETRESPDTLSAELAAFAGTPEGPSFASKTSVNEGCNAREAAISLFLNRHLLNRDCVGKGYIRRTKTTGFKTARRLCGLLGGSQEKLAVPEEASRFISQATRNDEAALVRLIADRGRQC